MVASVLCSAFLYNTRIALLFYSFHSFILFLCLSFCFSVGLGSFCVLLKHITKVFNICPKNKRKPNNGITKQCNIQKLYVLLFWYTHTHKQIHIQEHSSEYSVLCSFVFNFWLQSVVVYCRIVLKWHTKGWGKKWNSKIVIKRSIAIWAVMHHELKYSYCAPLQFRYRYVMKT